jgi:hypothetical protein
LTRAKAASGIRADAIRCQGGGQASLIFFVLLHLKPEDLMLDYR